MGIYYYFRNVTQSKINNKPIPGYGECTWIAKLDSFDEPVIIGIFRDVIQANEWPVTDLIEAYADTPGYPLIIYENSILRFDPTDEDDIAVSQRYPIVVSDGPEEEYDW